MLLAVASHWDARLGEIQRIERPGIKNLASSTAATVLWLCGNSNGASLLNMSVFTSFDAYVFYLGISLRFNRALIEPQ